MSQVTADRTVQFWTTDTVLNNPHMGFTTFQRFNGDALNPLEGRRWTEGFPIEYQPDTGLRSVADHPESSVAYFRVYWRFFEPEDGRYDFALFDKALETAAARGQTLMIRLAPYGHEPAMDIPDWLRAQAGPFQPAPFVMDLEDPLYAQRYGDAIRALARRYDQDPRLDSVDMSLCGQWGEGAGTARLSLHTMERLVHAYTRSFVRTPLMGFVVSPESVLLGNRDRPVGYRADCLGDMTTNAETDGWQHMIDYYPRSIAPMAHVWQKAPVSFEVCWVMYHWLDKGWDVDYIIEQSLKWHISTFNAKSSAVPPQWRPNVDHWLRRMGYRYALRFFDYVAAARAGDTLLMGGWMENSGVAPVYHAYPAVLRLSNHGAEHILPLALDVRSCLPGDTLFRERVALPEDIAPGDYQLSFGLISPSSGRPGIAMPLRAPVDEGYTVLGTVKVEP